MVWLTLAFEPLTVTFPALVGNTEALDCDLSLKLSYEREDEKVADRG
jgi:hypothetical protein